MAWKRDLAEAATNQSKGWDVTSERLEVKRLGKGTRDPKKRDRDGRRGWRSGIASQTLGPAEAPMGPLCTGKRAYWQGLSRRGCFNQSDIDALGTKELHELPPVRAPLPVSPEDRMSREQGRQGSRRASSFAGWPKNGADAAWFLGGSTIALALLSERTGTAMPDAGGIEHAQAAIAFRSPFLGVEREAGRTAKGTIWLGSEVRASNASHPRDGPHRRVVGDVCLLSGAWLDNRLRAAGRCEFGGTYGRGMEHMPQF
jgi:hypothetical protein